MHSGIALGVNIDHVATLRQQRHTRYPEPVQAALLAEMAGADNITLHLREDRRHIQERDVQLLARLLGTRMNLEMAATPAMVDFACDLQPADCCLVPERRAELTTEGGLDVIAAGQTLRESCARLTASGIRVALFIDADEAQIEAAAAAKVTVIELHTGIYADSQGAPQARELERLHHAAQFAAGRGLAVHAGHGLNYHNVAAVAAIPDIVELNIGHAIIARALFDGLAAAVRAMKALMLGARMIFGIGVDVLQMQRMRASYVRFGAHLVQRLLLDEEQAQFAQTSRPERFLALRFAAKEAIVKAMGTGFAHGIWIRDVGVVQNRWGKPEIIYSERGERVRRRLGIGEGHVTLTDEAGLIIAVAVLLRATGRRRASVAAAAEGLSSARRASVRGSGPRRTSKRGVRK